MTDHEKYFFDLTGYLVVKQLLSPEDTARLLAAAEKLEAHVSEHVDREPSFVGKFYIRYHHDPALGYNSYKSTAGGLQLIVDDFFNASAAFDVLIDHKRSMEYVHELSPGPHHIGSGEIRYRYRGNYTPTHMGGPIDHRNRYEFLGRAVLDPLSGQRPHRDFNLLTVRILYALHDIEMDQGPLCVVPGTHKANFPSPYGDDPSDEPGMIGIPLKAGDAILFTEHLRHAGFPNLRDEARKTIHMMFSPTWVGSQSPAHWNAGVYITQDTYDRYTPAQRALFCRSTPGVLARPGRD